MTTIDGVVYYSPREIANDKLIVNSRGNGDYGYIHRLINSGELGAIVYNKKSQIAYKLVSEPEIKRFNSQFGN